MDNSIVVFAGNRSFIILFIVSTSSAVRYDFVKVVRIAGLSSAHSRAAPVSKKSRAGNNANGWTFSA